MLPSDLLVARRRYGRIYPVYVYFDSKSLGIARKLIKVFKYSVGKKKGFLLTNIKKVEDEAFEEGLDYRFPRGLAHILMRRTVFKPRETKVDPLKLRLEVFKAVNDMFGGFILSDEEREVVYTVISEKYNLSFEEIEEIFRSSYEEEYTVSQFEDITPQVLIKEYNLSLTQTLLFKASKIVTNFEADGTLVKHILFNTKRLGLMYFAEKSQGEFNIKLTLDGPASLLRQVERYGTRLAKLLPHIIVAKKWNLLADILYNKRHYTFQIDSSKRYLFPDIELKLVEYDSSVEEHFYKRFRTLGSKWIIRREPEPILVGNHIFIPDFSFEYMNHKVYLEIMGFWTPEYLKRKVEKLSKVRDINLIIAVQKDFAATSEVKSLPHTVIVYKNKLPAPDVYRKLKEFEPKVDKEKKEEKKIEVPQEVRKILKDINTISLQELLELLKEYNFTVEQVVEIVEKEGFIVEWKSLELNNVIVKRRS